MQDYKKLIVWQRAHQFTLEMYEITRYFPREEMYGIVSQLRRATVSIACNIAGGCGKRTDQDLLRFLNIALGSTNETEYLLIVSKDVGYIGVEKFGFLYDHVNKIKAMLINLINSIQKNIKT